MKVLKTNKNNIFNSNKFKKHKAKLIFLIVIFIVIIAFLFYLFIFNNTFSNWFDSNAKKGYWEGKTEEEIKANLDAVVNEGEMNVSIANTIKFPDGSLNDGLARIENIAANNVDQKVSIYIENNDKPVYESGAIAPDYCINYIKLNKNLDAGIYKATAVFTGYNKETHDKSGVIAAQINILVE